MFQRAVQFIKGPAVLFSFARCYDIIVLVRYPVDTLEFDKGVYCMKKVLLILSAIFTVLTFAGAICVLASGGAVNAGYAVIPCAISIAFTNGYIWCKNKDNGDKRNQPPAH